MEPYYKTELSELYCGDCVETMKDLISRGIKVDKVITSPPYNIAVRQMMKTKKILDAYDSYQDKRSNDEYINWCVEIFGIYSKIVSPNGCILWNMSYGSENTVCMNLCIAEILKKTEWTLADILIWKKQTAVPNNVSPNKMTRICEFVYVFCRRSEFATFTTNKKVVGQIKETGQKIYENVFNFFETKNNDASTDLNKATFSTAFVNNLIDRYVLPTDVVLDNFSGTGTTMCACEQRNRKGYYIELSEAQCEYAKSRIKGGVQSTLWD